MLQVQQFEELSAKQYIMAAIACCHDKAYEKKKWSERLEYFETLDLDNSNIYKQASNPIGLRAAIQAYKDAIVGRSIGYTISLDAHSSGLQLLSLLVSCPISWKLCGGDENILDAYAEIYNNMQTNIEVTKSDVKQTIMTAFYGSTAMPKSIFKEDVDQFYTTLELMAPGAWDLNLGIQELWNEVDGTTYDWTMPDNFYCCIETHDKEIKTFTFLDKEYSLVQKVNERPRFHKGLGPNMIHSIDGMIVREMYRRCMFDGNVTTRVMSLITDSKPGGTDGISADIVKTLWDLYQESGFLSVRILDYLYHDTIGLVDKMPIAKLIQSLPDQSFDLISVHDCFRCHPNYGNDLRRQYNIICADINDSNILPFMASQIAKQDIIAKKVGTIPREVILNGNYLLS